MSTRSSGPAGQAARLAGRLPGVLAVLSVLCLAVLGGLVLAGLRPATEHSGSMAPDLRRGDLIFSRAVPARDVRVGDVVTFPDPYARGVLLTHRVRAERPMPGERIAFTTRGDANSGSEHWTIAASGTLTRMAFSVPRLGLPVLVLGSHPAYLALGAALALWLLALSLIWARADGGRAPAPRRQGWALACAVGLAALPATAALASVAAPREEGPSVRLAVNDGGLPLFELAQMRPGEQAIACERVANEGPSDARVGVWGQAGGTGLAGWLTLTLQRGALPASAGAGSCEGFAPDTADFEGLGPGVLYRGALDGFPAGEASALSDPGGVWPAGTAVAYRVTVSLEDANAAQGLSAVQRFLFGGRPADAPEGGAGAGVPGRPPAKAASPGATSGHAPAASPQAPPPAVPSIRGLHVRVGAAGVLRIGASASGAGRVSAAAFLARGVRVRVRAQTNGRPGVRTVLRELLTPLGASSCGLLRAGPFEITLTPLAAALQRLRADPRRYRVLLRLQLTARTGARGGLTAWASEALIARLARRATPR